MLPPRFLASLKNIAEIDVTAFSVALSSAYPTAAVRFNTAKPMDKNLLPIDKQVPWCRDGYYLKERPSFILDPFFHAGAYYVQEPSSMFLYEALKQTMRTDAVVLDFCAAPGGKSTIINSFCKNGLLVSNEFVGQRVNILEENLSKWGLGNYVITHNTAQDFGRLPHFFDAVLVDAPCSGSGMFRKDSFAVEQWNEKLVETCAVRQKEILQKLLPCLKKEGYLFYSTCSFSQEENEDIIDWLMDNFDLTSVPLNISEQWQIIQSVSTKNKALGYRFYPHLLEGEGFFIAVLKKKNGRQTTPVFNSRTKTLHRVDRKTTALIPFKTEIFDKPIITWKNRIYAIEEFFFDALQQIDAKLNCKKIGLEIGSIKGSDFVPATDSSLYKTFFLNHPIYGVDKATALNYLRKKDIHLSSIEKGWGIIQYENNRLGWVKILQNRINNYYPNEWRIRFK